MKQFFLFLLAAFVGAAIALGLERLSNSDGGNLSDKSGGIEGKQRRWLGARAGSSDTVNVPLGLNFVGAARLASPAVVSIQSRSARTSNQRSVNPFEEFFGNPDGGNGDEQFGLPSESSGSGVILTADGYIVTNNHVVDGATEVKVVLDDKRSFMAKIIGIDPTTDLALVKIDAQGLPFVSYGNSDALEIGEWVLALGNPYDLTQTVTAGIVSAKARNINILRTKSNMQIESFIQTDAAVNPGNSGGALVNLRGELVGINTAIASQTGSYTGYSFAVPVSIVKKVIDDLLQFGDVQRAVLGVEVRDISAEFAKEKDLPDTKGVYISGVFARSGAADAKLVAGDVIYKINGQEVNSSAQMIELVARNRPGDKLKITYGHNGTIKTTEVRLKSRSGEEKLTSATPNNYKSQVLGAELRTLTAQELKTANLTSGIKVIKVLPNGVLGAAGIKDGFIISALDKKAVTDPAQFERILGETNGGALLEGQYPNGRKSFYAIAPNAN